MIGTLLRVRYEVTQQVDEGPVFVLYRALDKVTGREVMIRTIRDPFSAEAAFVDSVRANVRELANIHHPGVERFVDVDEDEGMPFIVSEVRMGQHFDERLRRLAPYSVPVAISLTVQILEGLVAIQGAGFIHGELTSRHVLVAQDGKASLLQPGMWATYANSRLAGAAVLPTIANYLAPEVSQGTMPSPASDVYAVGVMLFEMLCARPPFSGDTPMALASKHMTAPVPSAKSINPSVPEVLEEVVRKAMSKDPSVRYETAKAMLHDCRIIQDAVRFGKQLTWPLSGTPAPAAASEVKVASSKSGPKKYEPPAVKADAAKEARKIDELDMADRLPRWLTGIAYAFVCALIVMIGGWVFWSLTKPKQIQVPKLEGMQVALAKQRLEGMGLTLREGRKEFSERQPEGVILKLDPAPGGLVREGAAVSAVISRGSKFVQVPDLRGRTLTEAKTLLLGLDLQVNEPIEKRRSRQLEPGRVMSTVPESRSKVERGTRIRLTVSSDRREDVAEISSARGSYLLTITMPKGIEAVNVRVDVSDVSGVRTIHDDRHRAGEKFEVEADGLGDPVYFKVFFNGQLVKSVEKSPREASGRQ